MSLNFSFLLSETHIHQHSHAIFWSVTFPNLGLGPLMRAMGQNTQTDGSATILSPPAPSPLLPAFCLCLPPYGCWCPVVLYWWCSDFSHTATKVTNGMQTITLVWAPLISQAKWRDKSSALVSTDSIPLLTWGICSAMLLFKQNILRNDPNTRVGVLSRQTQWLKSRSPWCSFNQHSTEGSLSRVMTVTEQ